MDYLLIGVGALVALTLALTSLLRALRRRRKPRPEEPDLRIDLTCTECLAVPEAPSLRFRGVPVRLRLVVLAPVGRDGRLPPHESWPMLFRAVLPGLAEVVAAHGTQMLSWPPQLSSRGFIHLFFRNLALPGDRGRGTPWCALAGPARGPDGQPFLLGMVLQAGEPVYFSCEPVEYETMWRNILDVRLRG